MKVKKVNFNFSIMSPLFTYLYVDEAKSKEDLEHFILDIVRENNEYYLSGPDNYSSIHITPIKKYYMSIIYDIFNFNIYRRLELSDINYLSSLFKNFCDNYNLNTGNGFIVTIEKNQHKNTIEDLIGMSTPN